MGNVSLPAHLGSIIDFSTSLQLERCHRQLGRRPSSWRRMDLQHGMAKSDGRQDHGKPVLVFVDRHHSSGEERAEVRLWF